MRNQTAVIVIFALASCVTVTPLTADTPDSPDVEASLIIVPASGTSDNAVTVPLNSNRIFGVIPDYQTVRDSTQRVAPMRPSEKWNLVWRNSIDPFNIGSAFLGAAMSQAEGEMPNYGEGSVALGKRMGAAYADFETQNVAAGFYAVVLHQDPRYFRKGPSAGIMSRTFYSLSRIVVTRYDSGHDGVNSSGLLGMMTGIAASNAYYPSESRTGTVMFSRIGTGLISNAMGNLLSEFWPDIQQKFFQRSLFRKSTSTAKATRMAADPT